MNPTPARKQTAPQAPQQMIGLDNYFWTGPFLGDMLYFLGGAGCKFKKIHKTGTFDTVGRNPIYTWEHVVIYQKHSKNHKQKSLFHI